MIQDPNAIFIYIITLIGIIHYQRSLRALKKVFKYAPPIIWIYFLPMLSSGIGIIPTDSSLYSWTSKYLLPPALILLLLSSNVKILSTDGSSILSPQIYWDPDEEWLFTEENIVFSGKDYNIRASKLDADRSFKLLKTGQLNGNFLFEDN